jgi:exportin-2 (importin alpha re-exporter)
MNPSPETLTALSTTLASTVSPDSATRRAAEEQLRQGEKQPGFLIVVLTLVNTATIDMVVRQTAGVYFKNAVKRLWTGEEDVSEPRRRASTSVSAPRAGSRLSSVG